MFALFERLITPFPDGTLPSLPSKVIPFLWACTKGVRIYVGFVLLLTALTGAFEAYLFNLLGSTVDALSQTTPQTLWSTHRKQILATACILLASIVVVAVQQLVKQQTLSGHLAMRLRWQFHRRMLGLSLSAYQSDFASRISAKVMQTAVAVRDTWLLATDMLVFISIYLVTIALVIGRFNLALLAPLLCWFGLTAIVAAHFVPRLSEAAKAQADAHTLTIGRITDTYSNIATVRQFSHTRLEALYARGAMLDLLRKIQQQLRSVTAFELVSHALSMGLIISTVGAALLLWARGQLTLGAVAATTAMALRLNGMSNQILWQTASLFDQIGVVKAGIDLLTQKATIVDKHKSHALRVSRGEIVLDRVTFRYGEEHNSLHPVLEDLSLHIRPGEKIGLVGRSGAGKSTVLHLLLRFYDVTSGRILIDGQDICDVTQDSLRSQIGMVTQDISLLNRSVRANILYGRPDASDEEMAAAAQRAGAHDFIMRLSDSGGRTGYDAHVGERGVTLSGGQRQRIVIARVMLKNAPILLLDEAMSALDSEIEATIRQSLYRLMEGKTIIAVAHRLSTIAAMDRLVVLDRGRVVEQGSHDFLRAQNGVYARLWAHHSGGFLGQQMEVTL